MKHEKIRYTDKKDKWAEKEMKRLFPEGDHNHIKGLMGCYNHWNIWDNFKPRQFKKEYESKSKDEN